MLRGFIYSLRTLDKKRQTEIGKETEDRKSRESITDKMFVKSSSHRSLVVLVYLIYLFIFKYHNIISNYLL